MSRPRVLEMLHFPSLGDLQAFSDIQAWASSGQDSLAVERTIISMDLTKNTEKEICKTEMSRETEVVGVIHLLSNCL